MKVVATNNRGVLEELRRPEFRLAGAEAVVAATGDEALAQIAAHAPDLAIVDVEPGGLDGYAVCERVKTDARLANVRVILVAEAPVTTRQLHKLAACGCDDVLVQGVPGEDLYRQAARLLGLPDPSLGEPVEVAVEGAHAPLLARALHLSPDGVALLVPGPLPSGAQVSLKLERKLDGARADVRGEVLRSTVEPSGATVASLRFVALDDSLRSRVRDLALWDARSTDAGDTGLLVFLRGGFNEKTEFGWLLDQLRDEVVFDLSGVRMINSWGAREWILFLRDLDERVRYSFVRCSPVFIKQSNMVADMLGRGAVRSFATPYTCSSCGKDNDRILQTSSVTPAIKADPPEFRCPACGGIERFSDLPDRFFSFLRA